MNKVHSFFNHWFFKIPWEKKLEVNEPSSRNYTEGQTAKQQVLWVLVWSKKLANGKPSSSSCYLLPHNRVLAYSQMLVYNARILFVTGSALFHWYFVSTVDVDLIWYGIVMLCSLCQWIRWALWICANSVVSLCS